MRSSACQRVFAGVLLLLAAAVVAEAAEFAPVNPDFVAAQMKGAGGVEGFGYVPSPVDWSHLNGTATGKAAPPASYDLRAQGLMTSVKNQSSCGACWSFAACGTLEGWIKRNQSVTYDFSENHMKNNHGFMLSHCAGGNNQMAMAYLLRGTGPLLEAQDPYNPAISTPPPAGVLPSVYVRSAPVLTYAPNGDRSLIQNMIMEEGPMSVVMIWNDAAFNSTTNTYYYTGNGTGPNDYGHMVTLVGWDDAKNVPGAAAPGAWICKNSWTSSWGEGGYFYISYRDTKAVGEAVGYYDVVPAGTYDQIYQHDPFGMTAYAGFGGNTAWGANVFTATQDGQITAVGTYALAHNTSVQITVYGSGFSGSGFTTPLGTTSATLPYAGYHVVTLATPVPVTSGGKFTVAVRYTTPGMTSPLPLERYYAGFANATAAAGQSYLSDNGTVYEDVTLQGSGWNTANLCIKALVDLPSQTPEVGIAGSPKVEAGGSLTLRAYATNMTGTVAYKWRKNGTDIDGAVSETLTLDPVGPLDAGSYVVVVTDESKAEFTSAPFVVTVLPEGALPAAGTAGLIALAAALSTLALRRRV